MMITASFIFVFLLISECTISKKLNKRHNQAFISIIEEEEEHYFGRLTNIDRKRWLAEEIYRRKHLGVSSISDETFESLRVTPGKRYSPSQDLPNFEILSNHRYQNLFQYVDIINAN